MDIRAHTLRYTHKSNRLGAASLILTFAVYALCLWGAVQIGLGMLSLPLVILLGFASVRLYVLQHDCGHASLFSTRWINDVVGYILSVVTLTPFRVMQHNHNLHHAYLGNLDHRETTEVYTMTVAEWQAAPMLKRLSYRIYRNPFVMLSLGGIWAYFIAYRWPQNTLAVGIYGVLAHNAMILCFITGICLIFGWTGLAVWGGAALLAGVIGVFLVYLQHNFEDTYWDRKPDLDLRRAALQGSSSLDLGWWWDLGTGNIAYHDLHHFNPAIPSYRLRRCQNELPADLKGPVIHWPQAMASFKLKLWDEQAERLVSYPGSPKPALHPAE